MTTPTMPKYTGTLLPEHLNLVEQIRDHRMRIGLSTDRCDRPAAEAAVRLAYKKAGLTQPPLMVWMDSPLGGAFAAATVTQLFKQGPPQAGQLGGQLGDQLGGQLGGQLWGQLRGQLGDQLGGQLRGQLGGQLGWDRYLDPWYEAYWIGVYAAALPAAGLPANERFDALQAAVDNTAWWWPMRGAVILTDRPTAIHMESAAGQTRLHCETGPAIGYADGYGLWSWHGTRVPQDLIETGWSWEQILREPNQEIRRCAIERMSWPIFIRDAGLSQAGETVDDPGNPGCSLSLYDVPERIYGDSDVRVLVATNGTTERDGSRHTFGLTVPADVRDPIAAAAWGYGLDSDQYMQLERRA